MASSACSRLQSLLSLRVLFPITLVALIFSLLYIRANLVYIPSSPDLCQTWTDPWPATNTSRHWWQWACMMERLWDKPFTYSCQDLPMMGNWPVCMDKAVRPQPPCLVYSFGIARDFTFDDAMAGVGCEVFSFDPSMEMGDHQHAPHVQFFSIGLGVTDDDNFQPKWDEYVKQGGRWKIRSLSSLLKQLGHTERVLDVLKIDVEVYEWPVLQTLLDSGLLSKVRQLLVEWHIFPNEPSRDNFPQLYRILTRLQEAGFQQIYMSPYKRLHHLELFNSQADTAYVNTRMARNS